MVIAIYPIVLAVIGALVMALSSNDTAKELGKATFWAGMFAFAFALAHQVLRLG